MMTFDSCTKCDLCRYRHKVVPGRGDIPADILFMGEGPGKSENIKGEAFIGPAGKLLDKMFYTVFGGYPPKYYITNTVLCRPTDTIAGDNRPPRPNEVLMCMPNVMQIVEQVSPRVVVFLGKVAQKYYQNEFKHSYFMYHPSYLNRTGREKSPYYKGTLRTLGQVYNVIRT